MGKEARNKARELRAAQVVEEQRRRRRNRLISWIGGLVILGLIAGIVVVVINAATKDDGSSASGKLVTPANLSASGAIPVGQADAAVTVEIYQDYICPACGQFEKANGSELQRMVQDGTIKLDLRPIAFLDDSSSGTHYSTRAANAVATVADKAPDSVFAFNQALYHEQPAEGSKGLSDDKIADIAKQAGVPQAVVDTFKDRTFEKWVSDRTDEAFKTAKISGTPTIKINGKLFDGDAYTQGPLTQAIQAAGGTK